MDVMGSLAKSGRTKVTEKLRRKVNKVVQSYVDQGVPRLFEFLLMKYAQSQGKRLSILNAYPIH